MQPSIEGPSRRVKVSRFSSRRTSWGKIDLRGLHRAQLARLGLGIKDDTGLLQNMRFNLGKVWRQGVNTSRAISHAT